MFALGCAAETKDEAALKHCSGCSADGAGIYRSAGNPTVTNVVVWGNLIGTTPSDITGTGISFSHSNIHTCGGSAAWIAACGTDSGGNVDTAATPFVTYRRPSGNWTSAPAYSSGNVQTTFADTGAPWVAGELVGMFIQPDSSNPQQLLIVANTSNTLSVWGDATPSAANGTMYNIHDLRLALGTGCIDSGDNNALPTDSQDLDADGNVTEPLPVDLDQKPRITNSTVDMGAYEHQLN